MNLKKLTQKNADGSSISYEFDVPKMDSVPNHPGEPKGTDTVPAWLTPGEFVMNAEATRMFEPQIEAMNDAGRAVQRQQGGTIPEYKAEGGDVAPPGYTDEDVALEGYLNSIPLVPERPQELTDQLNQTNPNLVPQEVDLTNAVSMSPVGLIADEVSSKDYQTPYDPRINPNRVQVPVQREDRSLLETLFGPAGALFPFGYTDKKEAEEDLVTLKTQRDNAVKSGNTDLVPKIDAEIDKQQSIIDSSDNYNQEVKTAKATNTARDLNDKIKQVTYSDATVEDKRTALLGLGLDPEEVNKILEDRSENNDTVIEVTKRKEQEAVVNSKAQDVDNAVKKTEGESNPGTDDVSTGKVIKTGEETIKTDPDMWDKAMSFIGDAFDEILDTKSLTQAAMLYLGSRALGYSHAGSINFVGKNYAKQIQSKLKTADKATLTNKYTKDSVEKYRKSGNLKDLELVKNVQLEDTLSMVDRQTGRSIIVNKYKDANTGKISYMTPDGKPIDMSTGRLISESDETSRSKRFMSTATGAYEAELSKLPDEIQSQFRERLPSGEAIGLEAYNKARELGLDESKIASIIPTIFRQMRNDLGDDSINETAFESYLNKQLINLSLKDYDIKSNFDKVPAKITDSINNKVRQNVPGTDSLVGISEFYRKAHDKYKDLEDSDKAKYKDNLTTGMTPFLVFVEMELDKLSNK